MRVIYKNCFLGVRAGFPLSQRDSFGAIFLPKEEAKRISTAIPNAKPTKLTYHVPFEIINDELKSKLNRFFTVNEMDDPEG